MGSRWAYIYWPRLRAQKAIRLGAWSLVAAGVAAPVLRKRVKLPKGPVITSAALAPVALQVVLPPSKLRSAATVGLQMWAYLAAYEMPYDDPEALEARVRVDYPVTIDRFLGAGRLPSQRLQKWFARPGKINPHERVLVFCHWVWFAVPHGTVAYVLLRHPERFPSAAARIYGVFDAGAVVYWVLPTAPPWYAAKLGRVGGEDDLPVRRMMLEYGEEFWGDRWGELYDVLGGNPLAAMPSLHFATSLMAARVLSETGPIAGAIGWTYAGTLGLALVYLGEHYAVDLIAGAALTEGVRRIAGPLSRPARALTSGLDALRGFATDS
jgi:PAP2 superfamily protein